VTAVQDAPATATGPTARTVARSARGPVLVVLALALTGLLAAALAATGPKGDLDPAAYNPSGSHALAALLEHGGVQVRRVTTVEQVRPAPDTTVLVPIPQALTAGELERLAGGPGELVLVDAGEEQLRAVGAAAQAAPPVEVADRRPACALPAAVRAGDVDLGGTTYRATGAADTVDCYASGGRATLLRLPVQRLTLLGSGDLLTNERLDRRGNAALALGLLGSGHSVQWVLPHPGGRDTAGGKKLGDLVPRGLKLAVLELLIAAAVLALWRARRLGPVVTEPLPVVVRASEAVEGRSRLYRAAHARGTAADALRAGTRDRVVRRLGLAPDAGRAATVDAVAARSRRDPAEVDALLYGAAPGDDAALVRLAADLSALEESLTREVAGP